MDLAVEEEEEETWEDTQEDLGKTLQAEEVKDTNTFIFLPNPISVRREKYRDRDPNRIC